MPFSKREQDILMKAYVQIILRIRLLWWWQSYWIIFICRNLSLGFLKWKYIILVLVYDNILSWWIWKSTKRIPIQWLKRILSVKILDRIITYNKSTAKTTHTTSVHIVDWIESYSSTNHLRKTTERFYQNYWKRFI